MRTTQKKQHTYVVQDNRNELPYKLGRKCTRSSFIRINILLGANCGSAKQGGYTTYSIMQKKRNVFVAREEKKKNATCLTRSYRGLDQHSRTASILSESSSAASVLTHVSDV